MALMRLRVRTSAVVLAACAGLAGGLATLGQDAPKEAAKPAPEDSRTKYLLPADNCKRCHSHPEDYRNDADRLLCRMLEFSIWDEKDKHKIAYKILKGARAKEMGDRLNINVTESSACINCHSTTMAGAEEGQRFAREDNGVSCLACHGAYRDWVTNHQFPADKKWRQNTRKEKETRFGMTDLWNPVTRATKCASCHIGNADEQKVVTHAMYAAGHPPLPGLETATYSDAQPRHWEYLREKNRVAQKDLGFDPGKLEQTELVVVSGIVALSATMHLYAAEAGEDSLVKEPETHWPDFARFDCYACHHDLRMPSWRQARGYGGRTPGRPTSPTWPAVLVRLGILVADPDGSNHLEAEFREKVEAFQKASGGRPFGDQRRSAAAARALADWADSVGERMRAMIEHPGHMAVDDAMASRLLRELCGMATSGPLDYDTARQIALAFRTIYAESRAKNPDPAIVKVLADLDRTAHLSLMTAGSQELIENTLKSRLEAVFDFDPASFQAQFAEIANRLGKG
jgi:hypothetical protein